MKTIDPVCGMNIDTEKAVGSSKFEGQTYYFCSRSCETKFDAAPAPIIARAPVAGSCCTPGGHSCH